MTFAKLGAFQLTVKTVNAFLFFYFPSCPLSLVYMQVPSSQERASNNFERTLMGRNGGTLVCYEDGREVFVSIQGFVLAARLKERICVSHENVFGYG